MPYFEITGDGFNGADDSTDDRVLWVQAESEDALRKLLDGASYNFCGELPYKYGAGCIDFVLPEDAEALFQHLKGFEP
jgi:hypothetical protein